MSRHSKWSTIKRQKGVTDQKRGTQFTKLANTVTMAARQGGPNPEINFKLRIAIEKARAANMPKENIERAIARAQKNEGDAALEQMQLEVIGPGGVGLVITATTDNRNRVVGALKAVLHKHAASLAGPNAVAWQFALRGHVLVPLPPTKEAQEELELAAIDAGSLDVEEHAESLILTTDPHSLERVKDALERRHIAITEMGIGLEPTVTVPVADQDTGRKLDNLIADLEAIDEVDEVVTNAA
ncbi:MAG: YebC/PmpR family DNA-binding transcriptional regulator [Patescibacteria group bacterium]